MKKINLAIGFILLFVHCRGQVIFEKRIAYTSAKDMRFMQQNSSGEYMVAGGNFIGIGGTGVNSCHVSKIDANGNVIWGRRYNNLALAGDNIGASALCPMPDGGAMVVGCAGNDDTTLLGNILLMRLDVSGNVMWSEVIGDTLAQVSYHGVSMVRTTDGNYAISAMTFYIANQPDYIAKVTDTGIILWQKLLAASDNIHDCAFISATSDGGFVACGRNLCLLRFDTNGNIVYRSIPTMPTSMGIQGYGYGTLITADSSCLVTGTVYHTMGTQSSFEVAAAKYSSAGVLLWYRKYKNLEDDWGARAVELDNGDFLIAGRFANSALGVSSFPCLLRIDSSGNFISVQRGPFEGEFQSIIRTPDNGIALSGYALTSTVLTSTHGLIAKIDSTFNLPCFITATATDSIFSLAHTVYNPSIEPVSNLIIKSITLSVVDSFVLINYCPALSVDQINPDEPAFYPNPANGIVTIRFKQNIDFPLTISFYTMQGKKLFSEYTTGKNNFRVDVSLLKAGIYIVDLNGRDSSIRKKLIVL